MQRIILRGQGSSGRNGGPNGDMFIEDAVKTHSLFTRDGNDLYLEIPISFTEAALGAEIEIPLLGGKSEKFTIPEGTQTGTVFKLRGKGIPDINNSRRVGDQVFSVQVETPTGLNDEQKKLFRTLAESFGKKPGKRENFFKKFFNK